MSDIITIDSVSQVHRSLGLPPPAHPLITVINTEGIDDYSSFTNVKVVNNLYHIGFKGTVNGSLNYGRNTYDFEEGTLVFTAPGQTTEYVEEEEAMGNMEGWSMLFHPDLIRKSDLADKITKYGFFEYASSEALHLSSNERNHIEDLRDKIQYEYNHSLDSHSLNLINSNLELLLDYCLRYYDRQFFKPNQSESGCDIQIRKDVKNLLRRIIRR